MGLSHPLDLRRGTPPFQCTLLTLHALGADSAPHAERPEYNVEGGTMRLNVAMGVRIVTGAPTGVPLHDHWCRCRMRCRQDATPDLLRLLLHHPTAGQQAYSILHLPRPLKTAHVKQAIHMHWSDLVSASGAAVISAVHRSFKYSRWSLKPPQDVHSVGSGVAVGPVGNSFLPFLVTLGSLPVAPVHCVKGRRAQGA